MTGEIHPNPIAQTILGQTLAEKLEAQAGRRERYPHVRRCFVPVARIAVF